MAENIDQQELVAAQQLMLNFLQAHPEVLQNQQARHAIQDLKVDTVRGLLRILSSAGKDDLRVVAFMSSLTAEQSRVLDRASLTHSNFKYTIETAERDALIKLLIEKINSKKSAREIQCKTQKRSEAEQRIISLLVDNLFSENNLSLSQAEIIRKTQASAEHTSSVLIQLSIHIRNEDIRIGGRRIGMRTNQLIFVEEEK